MALFSSQTQSNIHYAAELFRKAKHTVVLTGAGVSTPSGIPDFRSAGSGLWAKHDPMEVASLNTFRMDPERFFSWFRPLADTMYEAQPNPAHSALAELEQAGCVLTIVTQNIDTLHQKAGSNRVIEMHGTLETLSCTHCFNQQSSQKYLEPFVKMGVLPRCPECNELLKPDVILMGEQLPQNAWFQAQKACRQCDLMVIAGSSLEVLPVAGLPMQAIDRGAHLIIINNTPTYLDVRADINFSEDVAEILPAIAEQVLNGRN